jgi:hypothetical protein
LNAIIRLHLDEAGEDCIRRIVFSAEYFLDYLTFNVSKPEIPPHMAVSKAGMVKTEAMEYCCLQIIHVNGIFDYIHAEIIRLADCHARLDAGTRGPHCEATGVMVTPCLGFVIIAEITQWCTAELTAPDDQRAVQKSSLFQILDQSRDWARGNVTVLL